MTDVPPITQPPASASARLRSDLPLAILCLLMFLLPLYRTSILEDSFITPKVLLMQACTLVALLGCLLTRRNAATQSGSPQLLNPITIAFFALVIIHVISLLWTRSAALGVHAVVYWTSFLLLHVTLLLSVREAGAVNLLFGCGASAAVLTGAWTFFEDATHGQGFGDIVPRLPDWRGHLAAGLGNSGHIAGYMGLFLPWMLWKFFTLRSRPMLLALLIGLIILSMAFVVTWSVGSSGATILSLVIWSVVGVLSGAAREVRPPRIGLLLLPLVIACGVYFLPHSLNPHSPSLWKEAFASERWAEGWPTRLVIWKTTLYMIVHHLALGIGAGNYTLEYVRQVVPSVLNDPALRIYAGAFTNDAHNEYLQVLCETGLAGFGCFLVMIAAFYRRIVIGLREISDLDTLGLLICAGAGFTVFLLDALMSFPIRLPAHFASLAFFAAVPVTLAPSIRTWLFSQRTVATLLIPPAIACLLLQGRRVLAEYYLKQGRTTAEAYPITVSGQMMSQWSFGDAMLSNALVDLARGDQAQMRKHLEQARMTVQGGGVAIAEKQFRASLRWDPRYSNVSSRLGALLLMQGKYAEAVDVTHQTLRDLESPEIYERLGLAEFLLGDVVRARQAWNVCKTRRPMRADFYDALIRETEAK